MSRRPSPSSIGFVGAWAAPAKASPIGLPISVVMRGHRSVMKVATLLIEDVMGTVGCPLAATRQRPQIVTGMAMSRRDQAFEQVAVVTTRASVTPAVAPDPPTSSELQ